MGGGGRKKEDMEKTEEQYVGSNENWVWKLKKKFLKGMVSFDHKFFFFIFVQCLSHYARLVCEVRRSQDFFSYLKKIVLFKKQFFFVFPNSDE